MISLQTIVIFLLGVWVGYLYKVKKTINKEDKIIRITIDGEEAEKHLAILLERIHLIEDKIKDTNNLIIGGHDGD